MNRMIDTNQMKKEYFSIIYTNLKKHQTVSSKTILENQTCTNHQSLEEQCPLVIT